MTLSADRLARIREEALGKLELMGGYDPDETFTIHCDKCGKQAEHKMVIFWPDPKPAAYHAYRYTCQRCGHEYVIQSNYRMNLLIT